MAALTLARRSTRVRGGYPLASVLPSPPFLCPAEAACPPLCPVPESRAVAILGLGLELRTLWSSSKVSSRIENTRKDGESILEIAAWKRI